MRWLAPRMLRVQQRVQLQIVGVAHRFTEVGMHSRLDRPESVTHAHLRLLACCPLAPECALKLLSSPRRHGVPNWIAPAHYPDHRLWPIVQTASPPLPPRRANDSLPSSTVSFS